MAYKTADAREIEKKTEPYKLQVGADTVGALRPDLAGLRVKLPTQPQIYLIDPSGARRWVPDPTTYNNLFRDWNGVVVHIDINEIFEGTALTSGAILGRATNAAPVYLISNGVKRWITSPAVMDKYYFNWNRIYVMPPSAIDSIPSGPDWS